MCVALSFFYLQTIGQGSVFKMYDILNKIGWNTHSKINNQSLYERQSHKFLRFGFDLVIAYSARCRRLLYTSITLIVVYIMAICMKLSYYPKPQWFYIYLETL